jgi:hypothetical protein
MKRRLADLLERMKKEPVLSILLAVISGTILLSEIMYFLLHLARHCR